jgi:hypothetical protein
MFILGKQQIECKAKSCLFSNRVTCRMGEYFLQTAQRCIVKPLKELTEATSNNAELDSTCQDVEGCICQLSGRVFIGDIKRQVLLQKGQACRQQPVTLAKGVKFSPPEINFFECTAEFCPCNDNPHRLNVLFCTRGQTCHFYLGISACRSPGVTSKMTHTLYRVII